MSGNEPRLELYLRSLAPTAARDSQENLLERLEALDAADRIRGYDVRLCGDCVCPDSATADTEPGRRLLDRYDRFQAWAEECDRDLVAFSEREVDSLLTGTTITGIVFPHVVLAEYEDGELSFVAPSANGSEEVTVQDRLEEY